jgi:integrase
VSNLIPQQDSHLALEQSMTDIAGQIAETSKRIYLSDTEHFAHWLLNHQLTPDTVSRSDMIAYRSYLDTVISEKTGKPFSKSTKQRMFSVARRLMDEQFASERISKKVTTEIKGFKANTDETTHTALTKQQAIEMLASVDTSTRIGKRDYAILITLLKTGMRRSELVQLNWEHITVIDGHAVAIIEHGKGDKRRIAKLRVEVARAIQRYRECLPETSQTSPVFVTFRRGDKPQTTRLTGKAIELLVKKYAPEPPEGMEKEDFHLTPHGLRATFATLALEGKASLHQVQYAMGHSDPRITERYQKRKLNLDDNAVDVLNF